MKRILCIWLPSWPIQRLVVAQPEHSGRVIILHVHRAHRGRCVAACSGAAWRCGVRYGMPLAEAVALNARAEHAAEQVITDTKTSYIAAHDSQADWKRLQELAKWCDQFSPIVGFEHDDTGGTELALSEMTQSQLGVGNGHPSCLYIDATHLSSHFGGDSNMVRHVAESFDRKGYHVRVVLADTQGAAWAAAHYARQHVPFSVGRPLGDQKKGHKVISGKATGASLPCSSFLVIHSGKTSAAIKALPVESLRVPSHVVDSLQQLGVFTVQQLVQLPRASLPSRFGDEILRRWDQVMGLVEEIMVAYQSPPLFQADCSVEHPTDRHDTIQHILKQLAQRLAQSLIDRSHGAIDLVCTLRCKPVEISDTNRSSRHVPHSLCLGLSQPTDSASHLLELLSMQLDGQVLPGLVEHVTLQASTTAPLERRQGELFLDHARFTESQMAQLIDRLSTRLGSKAVVRPQLLADFQPENSFCYQDRTISDSSSSTSTTSRVDATANAAPRSGATRPLFLSSPPLPLKVVALAPDGPPAQLHLSDGRRRIIRHWGPERIETGWWRSRSVRRDYYRVETDIGQHLWLFRQLDDGKWFLHGTFE